MPQDLTFWDCCSLCWQMLPQRGQALLLSVGKAKAMIFSHLCNECLLLCTPGRRLYNLLSSDHLLQQLEEKDKDGEEKKDKGNDDEEVDLQLVEQLDNPTFHFLKLAVNIVNRKSHSSTFELVNTSLIGPWTSED